DTGGEDIDQRVAIVREWRDERATRLPRRRPDFDPVLRASAADVVRRREARLRVGVLGVVPGGVHHEYATRIGVTHRRVDDGLLRRKCLAEAHVDDAGAIVDRITNRVRDVFVALVAIGYGPHHHDLHSRRDPADTDGAVPHGADNPGNVRPVFGVGTHDIGVPIAALRGRV